MSATHQITPPVDTTFIESFPDGSELHRFTPITERGRLEIPVLALINQYVALLPVEEDETKSWTYKADDGHALTLEAIDSLSIFSESEQEIIGFKILRAFTSQALRMARPEERITATRSVISVIDESTAEIDTPFLWHTDHEYDTLRNFGGTVIKVLPSDSPDISKRRLITSKTLFIDPALRTPKPTDQGTRYIDGDIIVPRVRTVSAVAQTEREMYVGYSDQRAALVDNAGSLVRLPIKEWLPPASSVSQLDEEIIGEVDALCVHQRYGSPGTIRINLTADVRVNI